MLGIRPAYDGLIVDPCIPKEWPGFEVERSWRGARYRIAVKNPARVEKGVKSVLLNGKAITGMTSSKIARAGLAHSPEGRRVFATLSVTDNLLLGAFPRLTFGRERGDVPGDLARVFELFPRLKERATQQAGTLSGGEQQMLAMGRALMLNPEVLLLDEPSMGLAPLLVKEVFRIIGELKGRGITMLLVEQFAAAALDVADYGYVLENGHISCHGPAQQLKNDPAVKAAYLGASH
jgi:branched-chain amino acid transport system ATP-binding protein